MEIKEWKDIIGYEGLYQISNLGDVKSLGKGKSRNTNFSKERILKQGKNKLGYCQVTLCKDGKQKMHLVHRLVASHFLSNTNNLPQVNHKDENPQNNMVSNLEFCDAKYNSNYGLHNERLSKALKGRKLSQEHIEKSSKKHQKPIVQLTLNGEFIKQWDSATQASKELNFNGGHICTCCKGKLNSAGKYKWKYLSDYINEQINYLNELKKYKIRLYDILKKVS